MDSKTRTRSFPLTSHTMTLMITSVYWRQKPIWFHFAIRRRSSKLKLISVEFGEKSHSNSRRWLAYGTYPCNISQNHSHIAKFIGQNPMPVIFAQSPSNFELPFFSQKVWKSQNNITRSDILNVQGNFFRHLYNFFMIYDYFSDVAKY